MFALGTRHVYSLPELEKIMTKSLEPTGLILLVTAATIPAAMVIATVAEPTQILTNAATIKATRTRGRFADETNVCTSSVGIVYLANV